MLQMWKCFKRKGYLWIIKWISKLVLLKQSKFSWMSCWLFNYSSSR